MSLCPPFMKVITKWIDKLIFFLVTVEVTDTHTTEGQGGVEILIEVSVKMKYSSENKIKYEELVTKNYKELILMTTLNTVAIILQELESDTDEGA